MGINTVVLTNEDGYRVAFDVPNTLGQRDAIIEAWRLYRELSYQDGEWPPAWAKPKFEAIDGKP